MIYVENILSVEMPHLLVFPNLPWNDVDAQKKGQVCVAMAATLCADDAVFAKATFFDADDNPDQSKSVDGKEWDTAQCFGELRKIKERSSYDGAWSTAEETVIIREVKQIVNFIR